MTFPGKLLVFASMAFPGMLHVSASINFANCFSWKAIGFEYLHKNHLCRG